MLAGQTPTVREETCLRRVQRHKDEEAALEAYSAVPKGMWCRWAGRQSKVVNEQAFRYGLPLNGRTIDLSDLALAFHDFLARNSRKLAAPDSDDPMLGGGTSPALERYRLANAQKAELDLEERAGELVQRARVRDTLLEFAAILRGAGETLGRLHGPEALDILDEAIGDCEALVTRAFGGSADAKQSHTGTRRAAALPQDGEGAEAASDAGVC